MNNMKKTAVLVSSLLCTTLVSAASLDFREEYKHGGEQWAGRVLIGGNSGSHNFSVEMKHSGHLGELQRGDSEFVYSYNFDLADGWRLQPGMPVTFGSNNVTYKPQLRIQKKFDNGVTAKFRYRHEFRNYSSGNTSTGRDGEKHDSLNASKLTGNLEYTWNQIQLGFEANYKEDFFSKEWKVGNKDGEYEWDYNLKVGYKIQNSDWRPYVEFGNVQCNSACDDKTDRQLRSRVGITYKF